VTSASINSDAPDDGAAFADNAPAQTVANTDVANPADVSLESLVPDAVALADQWAAIEDAGSNKDAERLGLLVSDPAGLALAVGFVDDVARPQDVKVAAKALAKLGAQATDASFLSPVDRVLFRLGAIAAPVAPSVVVPAARLRLKQLVGHLVADAGPGLGTHLARTRDEGYALNVNLLGEAVLGSDEADARLRRTIDLVKRDDVDYVSIKVSSVAAQLVTWDLEGSRDRVVEELLPLYRAARDHGVFINLDMEEYRDLALTCAVFEDIMGREEFKDLYAGIVLQAYLPDALGALNELTDFATARVAGGGAPIKIRLVKGANLAMEQVEAELHDWEQAPYDNKPDVDANFLRLLDVALTPERTKAVRIGVASHNLFHLALAVLLARARGVGEGMDVEMLQGMAPAQALAVRQAVEQDGGRVVLYTPAVRDEDFDVAIAYLVRRLEENAAEQNYLHAQFAGGADALAAQEAAFRKAVDDATEYEETAVSPRRNSVVEAGPFESALETTEFRNAIDSDPALPETREWAKRIIDREASGYQPVQAPVTEDFAAIDDVVARAIAAQQVWAQVPAEKRSAALRAIARRLEEARSDLVAAEVHEAGKTVAESDPEVSEAIDFANYYAQSALALDQVNGAQFTPEGVTLVTPPWNFPVAIPAGGVLAALAAGSSVIAKPANVTPRCFEIVIDAVHAGLADAAAETGLTAEQNRDLVQFIRVPENEFGRYLVTHDGVARVILTGAIETAEMFADWRPDRPVFAETSGKNAIVVTPSADIDLAVADVLRSAFGHAGQKCSAASLAILVGSVGDPNSATGERFRRQLIDAVQSLAVGPPTTLSTVMGPLTEPAGEKLTRALTELDPGERWLVKPELRDDEAAAAGLGENRLWTPGLRDGVKPGSWFHLNEAFGPVLGLMTAEDLDEAIKLQNATAFGLTAGLHSLDEDEIEKWKNAVQAGNLYVNRHITGAIVQRQPFGGWKASSVGPGAKAGGPHYVAMLGQWSDAPDVPSRDTDPAGWLAWAKADDAREWQRLSQPSDPTGLKHEENTFRMRPIDHLTVRVGDGAKEVEVERVVNAAKTVGAGVTVSRTGGHNSRTSATHEAFAKAVADGEVTGRIRVIGSAPGLHEAAAKRLGTTTVLDAPVVASGARELLNVTREQAVSRTNHRYGHLKH